MPAPCSGPRQKAILSALSDGRWVPGRELADRAGVKAKILWAYIERLRDRGYGIEGHQCGIRFNGERSRGYRLLWLADGRKVERADAA